MIVASRKVRSGLYMVWKRRYLAKREDDSLKERRWLVDCLFERHVVMHIYVSACGIVAT